MVPNTPATLTSKWSAVYRYDGETVLVKLLGDRIDGIHAEFREPPLPAPGAPYAADSRSRRRPVPNERRRRLAV